MPSRLRHLLFATLVLAGIVASPPSAEAQLRRVLDLNRQAMDAYTNLELETAMNLLQEALQTAQRGGVTGSPLARTYLNLGVVSIGGFGDNGQGLQYFTQALQSDPNIQLDPLTSTPDISSVFSLARNRVGGGGGDGGGGGGGGGGSGGGSAGGGGGAPPSNAPGNIPHHPVDEQLTRTAIPIFVEAPEDAPVGEIFVYYKSPGMRDFQRLQMRRVNGGFGLELPCSEVMAPKVDYYIVAFDADGGPMGTAGSPEQPFSIPVVSQRTLPPAALPGQIPPEQCSEEECPPGMECDHGGSAGLGDTCVVSGDCRSGLSCSDNFCVAEEEDGDSEPGETIGFFADVGFSAGLGYASSGKQADRSVADCDPAVDGSCASFISPDTGNMCTDGDPYCEVRVQQPGFVFAPALRIVAGYWIIPRFAVAAHLRYAFSAGEGPLSSVMIGLRGMVQLTQPAMEGFHADAFLGTSYGQYQIAPPQSGAAEPYIISGSNSLQIGGNIGYRIMENFGVKVTPEFHILFPQSLWAIDLTLAASVSF